MATIDYRTSKIVTAPVSLKAVADLLNTTANSDGVTTAKYDVGSVCTSGKINKWSKHKPVKRNVVTFNTNNETHWAGNGAVGSDVYGLQISFIAKHVDRDAMNVYDSEYNYTYVKPTGGASSPYRIGDFVGYAHSVSSIYIDKSKMNRDDTIYYSASTTQSPVFTFTVFGGKNNKGLCFSDLESVISDRTDAQLMLVASVYNYNTNELIAEYINNSIKLYSDTTALDTEMDGGDSYKTVSVVFDNEHYWDNNVTAVIVYLTLQTVYKASDGQYKVTRVIALPYNDDDQEYFTNFKFLLAYRYMRATKFHNGADGTNRRWSSLSSTTYQLSETSGTPDIMFEISKLPNDPLTLNSSNYFMTKYTRKSDGMQITARGVLINSNGSEISSQTVPSGTSGTENVYVHFGNIFQESYSIYQSTSQFTAEVYLVTNGNEEQATLVDTITFRTR